MIYTPSDLSQLILGTRTLSVWNREKGPVFWYAANVPGPFCFNTEYLIGADLAERLLREITAIVAGTLDSEARAEQLNHLILPAYKAHPQWQKLIATMIDRARADYGHGPFTAISGGERRDWLFSIPLAHDAGLTHLFLFKNRTAWSPAPVPAGSTVLHVSDLINNAASFFGAWLPTLDKAGISCGGNLCVTVRGDAGLKRLHAAGQKVSTLISVNVDFFRRLHSAELIDSAACEEISIFFASASDWAEKYLMNKPQLFDAARCDAKAFDRLRHFVAHDPWGLRGKHAAFFAEMEKEIATRAARAA